MTIYPSTYLGDHCRDEELPRLYCRNRGKDAIKTGKRKRSESNENEEPEA